MPRVYAVKGSDGEESIFFADDNNQSGLRTLFDVTGIEDILSRDICEVYSPDEILPGREVMWGWTLGGVVSGVSCSTYVVRNVRTISPEEKESISGEFNRNRNSYLKKIEEVETRYDREIAELKSRCLEEKEGIEKPKSLEEYFFV
jgi:hypothetical protein